MTLAYASTVVRASPHGDAHGRLWVVDVERGEVRNRIELPARATFMGARGGSRGGRGVAVHGGRVYVAVFDAILVYSPGLELLGHIQHPHVIGHHEIQVDADGIWCCSTLVDAVFKLDFTGRELDSWWAGEDPWAARHLRGKPRLQDHARNFIVDAASDDAGPEQFGEQYHLNNVFTRGAEAYAFACNRSALIRFRPDRKLVARNRRWESAHNVCLREGKILVNNTRRKRLEIWSGWRWWGPELSIPLDDAPGPSDQSATSGWLRGLAQLSADELLIGTSPAAILHVHLGQERVLKRIVLADDVRETVHGLYVARGEP